MKNAATRSLYEYWTRLRHGRVAPERSEIEPSDIRAILGDTFILEAANRSNYSFRLAGTRLCAAYGRELKGRNLLDFWTGRDRESVACLLAAVVEDGAAAVIGVSAHNERGQSVAIEAVFLPLHHNGPGNTRILGCYAPMEQPYWLGMYPLVRQPVQSVRLIWPDEKPSFLMHSTELAACAQPRSEPPPLSYQRRAEAAESPPMRRVGHLRVIEGGRSK